MFIDLIKYLDYIDHGLLLSKLKAYGTSEDGLRWFRSYLTGRRQRVLINGLASIWRPVERGVPRGSILGPLLFCIFVNDLPERINQCSVSLYADDTTLYHSSKDSTKLKNTLESTLDDVANWVGGNGLKINIKKTQVIFLGRKGRKKEVENASINHQGVTLMAEPNVKFPGVTVDRLELE